MDIPTRVSNLRYKFKDIPHIFYLNLDKRLERKKYIEDQFQLLGVNNFTRISADRYGPHNYREWKSKISCKITNEVPRLSTLLNQLQVIIDWYDSNNSEYCIISEDDINYTISNYWPFTWEQFFYKLPCNWDCVQLHVIGEYFVPMGLTNRFRNNHSAACYLINRRYAKKLKEMHYVNGKFIFHQNYGYESDWPEYHYQSADFVPFEVGVTYTFPLFITKSSFESDSYINSTNFMARESDIVTLNWWKNLRTNNLSLEDIFSRDSEKRKEMNLPVKYHDLK